MLRNYCKIAWRNLLRNKTNSLINIGGLAIGITCVVFIALYVQDDLGYDKCFKKGNRIYQVLLEGNFGGQQFLTSNTPPPVGMAMQTEFPEVEASTRIHRFGNEVVRNPSSGFAYRVPMSASVFVIAGLLAIVIALLTVSFQAIRAATRNPARSLKVE
ncbi:MAG TPA: hypothetical protein VF939_26085 [Puia sp.]